MIENVMAWVGNDGISEDLYANSVYAIGIAFAGSAQAGQPFDKLWREERSLFIAPTEEPDNSWGPISHRIPDPAGWTASRSS